MQKRTRRIMTAGLCALGIAVAAVAGNKWEPEREGSFEGGSGAYTNFAGARVSIAGILLNASTFTTNHTISIWVTDSGVSNILAQTSSDPAQRGTNTFAFLDGEGSIPLNKGERILFNSSNTNPITWRLYTSRD